MARLARTALLMTALAASLSCTKGEDLVTIDFEKQLYTIYTQGSTEIVLLLSEAPEATLHIPLTFSGTAVKGKDYTVSSETVEISAGETSGSVILSDKALTEEKELGLGFTAPEGYKPGNRFAAVVSLNLAEALIYRFKAAEANVMESYVAEISLQGSLSGKDFRAEEDMAIPLQLTGPGAGSLRFVPETEAPAASSPAFLLIRQGDYKGSLKIMPAGGTLKGTGAVPLHANPTGLEGIGAETEGTSAAPLHTNPTESEGTEARAEGTNAALLDANHGESNDTGAKTEETGAVPLHANPTGSKDTGVEAEEPVVALLGVNTRLNPRLIPSDTQDEEVLYLLGALTPDRLAGTWEFVKIYDKEEVKTFFAEMGDDPALLPLDNAGFRFTITTSGGFTPNGKGAFSAFFRPCTLSSAAPVNACAKALPLGRHSMEENQGFLAEAGYPYVQTWYYELSTANRAFDSARETPGKAVICVSMAGEDTLQLQFRDYDAPPFGLMWWDEKFDPDLFGFASEFRKVKP